MQCHGSWTYKGKHAGAGGRGWLLLDWKDRLVKIVVDVEKKDKVKRLPFKTECICHISIASHTRFAEVPQSSRVEASSSPNHIW